MRTSKPHEAIKIKHLMGLVAAQSKVINLMERFKFVSINNEPQSADWKALKQARAYLATLEADDN